MGKHFLATISNDFNNLFGIRFLCSFFSKLSDHQVTLLHICRPEGAAKCSSISSMWKAPGEAPPAHLPAETVKAINGARSLLGEKDIPVSRIITKTVQERYGKVKDILHESAQGLYDAIVLGRRASYALQWMFERPSDETFQALLKDSSCVTPLWICPDLDPKSRNVLLCIDGSENSYRAVDHVGDILSAEDHQSITLFHVENSVGTECVQFFRRSEAILEKHSISPQRIFRKVTWGLSVSGTIESESKKGGYAVIALGMGGRENNPMSGSSHLMGKTALKLMQKIDRTSLWYCP
jgi:hypothetical protein